jgi:hypothetical protein
LNRSRRDDEAVVNGSACFLLAPLVQPCGEILEPCAVASHEHEILAPGRQLLGEGETDAGRRAGDESSAT